MRRQRGYTLIELMIGLLVGLIVLSAVLYSFLVTLRSSRDVVNSSLVTNEVSFGADLISGELRRAGYSDDSSLLPPADTVIVVSGATISDSGGCVFYTYDFDGIPGLSSESYKGFRSINGTLQFAATVSSATIPSACAYSASASPWVNASDPRVEVTGLSFVLGTDNVGSSDKMLVIDFNYSASVVSDPDWTASTQKTMEVRNHYE